MDASAKSTNAVMTKNAKTKKKLLVAIDASSMAREVIAHAVKLARELDGKICLLHVVRPIVEVPPPGALAMQPSNQLGLLVTNAWTLLRELHELIPSELREDMGGDVPGGAADSPIARACIVEIGAATESILSTARSHDADLVVIGAHDHNVLARALGTTAARVANRIDRPLIVVRPIVRSSSTMETQGNDTQEQSASVH